MSVFGSIENIVEIGKNASYKHFLPFLQSFQEDNTVTQKKNTPGL